MRDDRIKGTTVHGFRSAFTDWLSKRTRLPKEVADKALAHTLPNKVEAAYRRTDFFDKRRSLRTRWPEFLDKEPAKAATGAPERLSAYKRTQTPRRPNASALVLPPDEIVQADCDDAGVICKQAFPAADRIYAIKSHDCIKGACSRKANWFSRGRGTVSDASECDRHQINRTGR